MDLTDCLTIEEHGRAGRITAKVGAIGLSFEWEFGGGNTVVIIFVPTPIQWSAQEPWQSLDRNAVLDALGRELCRVKCRDCEHSFDDKVLELRKRAE